MDAGVGNGISLLAERRQAVKHPGCKRDGISKKRGQRQAEHDGEHRHPAVESSFLPGPQLVRPRRHGVGELDELAAEGGFAQEQDEGVEHHPHASCYVQRVDGDAVPQTSKGTGHAPDDPGNPAEPPVPPGHAIIGGGSRWLRGCCLELVILRTHGPPSSRGVRGQLPAPHLRPSSAGCPSR